VVAGDRFDAAVAKFLVEDACAFFKFPLSRLRGRVREGGCGTVP
jgi:hypothetical protein